MNILFLTVSAGGGHLKAAEAITQCIDENFPDAKTHIVDAYKYVSPILDKVVIGSYLKTLKNSPKLWGKIYELAEKGENVSEFSQTLHKIFNFKIKRLVSSFKPDVIVCTHPFPLQMACNLKSKMEFNVPIVNVITDYASHSLWVNKYVDAYIVAHDGLIGELEGRGVPRAKIYPFGIPVDTKFSAIKNRNKILSSLQLEDKPTLLIMSGLLGIGKIKNLFTNLLKSNRDFQIIVVCGNNQKLKKQLEKIYETISSTKKVVILGYSDRINELMSISDILITKPGGMTITEALLSNIPIAIISPIPGQEEKNATFLLNNGVGISIYNFDNVDRYIFQYIDNPLRIRHIKEMSQYLAKPNSTNNIVMFLNQLAQKSQK